MRPDPNNIQSMIVARYPHVERVILLFRIDNPEKARAFLRTWLDHVHGGLKPPITDAPMMHFAFNWPGIARLLSNRADDDDGLDLVEGAAEMGFFFTDAGEAPHGKAVAQDLGFVGINAAEHWWTSDTKPDEFHIAIFGYFHNEGQKQDYLARIREEATGAELFEWQMPSFADKALSGRVPSGGILHFGYRDGISRIKIDWEETKEPGTTDFREFILGYSNETYVTKPIGAGPWTDFARDGSYLGIAWLYQDVAAFNGFLAQNRAVAAPHSGTADPEEWLAAKMMGRWKDGSSTAHYPNVNPTSSDARNDFGYTDDEAGEKTPLFSHIRVCNLRDQKMKAINRRRFKNGPPQLIRRGFSYGPPLNGIEDDGNDRGLIGVFACARLNEQLYTVLRWIQKTDFSKAFFDVEKGSKRQDNLFGSRELPHAVSSANIPLFDGGSLDVHLKNFIRYKGLTALFAPSLPSLKKLVGLPVERRL